MPPSEAELLVTGSKLHRQRSHLYDSFHEIVLVINTMVVELLLDDFIQSIYILKVERFEITEKPRAKGRFDISSITRFCWQGSYGMGEKIRQRFKGGLNGFHGWLVFHRSVR